MRKRVVITGMGCVSPLGNDVSALWSNILAGKSGVGLITHYDTSRFEVKIGAEVKDFDGVALFGMRDARRMDRFVQFAMAAAFQAVKHANLAISELNRDRIGVMLGTGIGGMNTLFQQMEVFFQRGPDRVSPFLVPMMLPDTAAGMVAIQLGVRGPNMAIVSACASGTNAIGEAAEVIRRGGADVIITGGSEAVIVPIAMAGLGVMNALSTRNDEPERASRPFDKGRDGFVMGEGGAILILESVEHAQARGAKVLGEISGYGTSNDAFHISAPAENGAGAALCMKGALDDAGLSADDIGYINAHGTSTQLNDKSETAAIKTVFGRLAYNIPISSTKSMTGHLLGAAGALEALICVKTLQDGVLPPTINYETPDPECDLDYVANQPRHLIVQNIMSNSFGFGGHNASIIISRYNEV
ncbi:MAG: beta-ketoacyl-[acyl-carrier-protein] synthase II [Chloroflexi bacterium RBG_19FT_COMBO_47_9]|nr:MAG: beta-ketoacyl-[acyl-carrier-protein] synthase II [Chloroflexi bacterium RBG_19FT_COMBO_47_9]